MRKFRIIPIIVALCFLASCSEEENIGNETKLGKDEIAFALNGIKTKSATAVTSNEENAPINIELGNGYYLEESVSSMDELTGQTPETRGIPIYNSNLVEKRTENISVAIVKKDGTSPSFGPDNYSLFDESNRIWRKKYDGKSPWDAAASDDEDLYFFVYSDPSGEATGISYTAEDEETMSMSFSYTSPTGDNAATKQEDILFTGKAESRSEYYANHVKTGIPVTFYHALTAVKFRVGNDNSGDTKTIITGVKFKNLKYTGTCTVTPNATTPVEWTASGSGTFSQTFSNPTYDATKDNTVSFESGDGSNFGDSFYAAAADNNLNNADGSLTFFFIPQTIGNEVTLEVTFRVKTPDTPNGTEITHLINFGEVIKNGSTNNVTWNAGELRTYTLKPTDVDVEIFDTMDGLKKDALHVTNTGNVDEYVRMMVIGNWYGWETAEDREAGKEPVILVGYVSSDPTNDEMVRPWFREDDVYGQFFDDSFKGGRPAAGRTDWLRSSNSYFYYTEKIGPGEKLDPQSTPLFDNYTLPVEQIPTIWVAHATSGTRIEAVGVHLVMEVVIQAIGVPTNNSGDEIDWKEAWEAAIDEEIVLEP